MTDATANPGASRDQLFQRGLSLHRTGDDQGAREAYEAILSANPADFGALHMAGVIEVQAGRPQAGFDLISRAIAVSSAVAAAYSNRGCALNDMGRHAEALNDLDRAIALQPDYPEAHCNRGAALAGLGRPQDALLACNTAIGLKPDYVEAYNSRGNALHSLGRLTEAMSAFETAIGRAPGFARAHFNLGNTLRDLGRPIEAIASFDRAIAVRPDYREAHCNKALVLLQRGDHAAGWEAYEWRLRGALLPGSRAFPQPQLSLDRDVTGATVFLHWEQGLGDTIQFCRYALLLAGKGARVILSVQDPLTPLLKQLEPRVAVIGGAQAPSAFDYHCPLMSLPHVFGTRVETIPSAHAYLTADPAIAARWAARLPAAGKPRIGFAVSGRPAAPNDAQRSIAMRDLAPLFAFPAEWICLHKELRDAEAAALAGFPQVRFHGADLTDFAQTAGLIANLDLVITVDTSIAHLAGAMGKPVWLLLSEPAEWRWLEARDDTPWYPSATLFRQKRAGDWPEVFARVLNRLAYAFPSAALATKATILDGGPLAALFRSSAFASHRSGYGFGDQEAF